MKTVVIAYGEESGFHSKLLTHTALAFRATGFFPVLYPLRAGYTHWRRLFAFCRERGAHLHLSRLLDPHAVVTEGLNTSPRDMHPTISALHFGVAELYRKPEYVRWFCAFVGHSACTRCVVMSIDPQSAERAAHGLIPAAAGQWPRLSFIGEPPYDEQYPFTTYTKLDARNILRLPVAEPLPPMVLYYGTYWFSKGADLLLEAARRLPDVSFCLVGDQSKSSLDRPVGEMSPPANVTIVDRWVSDQDQALWFAACDVVALPYRRHYEHDTSGVFNLAMLARRPVVAPGIEPFRSVAAEYPEAVTLFEPGNVGDLATAIDEQLQSLDVARTADRYLAWCGRWGELARVIIRDLVQPEGLVAYPGLAHRPGTSHL